MAWLSKEEITNFEQQTSSLQLRVKDLLAQVQALQKREGELKAELSKAVAEKDKRTVESGVLKTERNKLADDLARAQDNLQTLQAELKVAKAQSEQNSKEVSASKKSQQDADASLAKAKADGEQLHAQIKQITAELNTAKAQTKTETQEKEKAKAQAQAEADEKNKAKAEAKANEEKAQAQIASLNQQLAQAKDQAKEQIKTETAKLKTDLANVNKELSKLKAASQDVEQENELLLLQLMQAQEELVEYYEDKQRFEKLFSAYKARWDRLEKRYPNYMDFEGIELVSFDAVSEIPSITWRVKDFAQAGIAFDAFLFQTVMQDGLPGLAVIADPAHLPEVDSALVPKLLQTNPKQLEKFLGFTNTEFRQIKAAATVLAQLESVGWKDFQLPAQFDLSFWRPILKQLVTQVLSLPAVLRYDQVKLKRELINPDYEHLWLEFHGVNYGAMSLRKFEARLGAALVQRGGFSKFPKFEIPLIDGKTKPFESWYAESQDDLGAKLELRFSLEKNAFDVAVWNKLDDIDKAFVLRLVYAFPQALKRLEAQHTDIHRPWATWIDFAKAAQGVLEVNRKATQAAAKADKTLSAQKEVAPEPAKAEPTPPAKVVAEKVLPTTSVGVKVIHISGAGPKANTNAKIKPAKPKAVATKSAVNKATAPAKKASLSAKKKP